MKILVTGGCGFIGTHVTKKLIADGHEVLVTSTGAEPVPEGVARVLYCGLTGMNMSCARGLGAVVHLMANNDTLCRDRTEMQRANVIGPLKLFDEARKHGCRAFVYASSTAVYGNSPAPYVEGETPEKPINAYAMSKLLFDRHPDVNGVAGCVGLRFCNVYGPGEERKGRRMSMVGQLIRKAMSGQDAELFRDGNQRRDWIYVEDAVQSVVRALAHSVGGGSGVYNVGGGVSYTFKDVVDEVRLATDRLLKVRFVDCPFPDSYQSHTECDISKARRELGFDPQFPLRSGITDYVRHISGGVPTCGPSLPCTR